MRIRKEPGYSFDDVLLTPRYSEIEHRADVDLSTKLGSLDLKLPVFSANMESVTEVSMAMAMHRNGGAGVLHRFATRPAIYAWASNIRNMSPETPIIVSVGLDPIMAYLRELVEESKLDAICVDVAHGDHERTLRTVDQLRREFCDMDIIAGNVATSAGACRLVGAGANIIKVGIGPGSVCTTRIVTGHGVPQLSAIMEISETLRRCDDSLLEIGIIADGGIRNSGDAVKALAAGAHAVMLGSMLAATAEAPGDISTVDGKTFKTYRGMASREVQEEKRRRHAPRVEGVSVQIPFRGSVNSILDDFAAGVRSGLSYSGAHNLHELRRNAEFIVVTGNTVRENQPHNTHGQNNETIS